MTINELKHKIHEAIEEVFISRTRGMYYHYQSRWDFQTTWGSHDRKKEGSKMYHDLVGSSIRLEEIEF